MGPVSMRIALVPYLFGQLLFFLFLGKPLDTSSELTPRPKTLEKSIQ